ncbi:MAG TPA: hypothetical protein DCE61_06320, partial [Cellvibrionales bacterium]|nr:hypothetical protein [Cellvibrionales bacterium]
MSAGPSKLVQVVIASPVRHHFDYLPAEGQTAMDYRVGTRVEVPFGRRNMTGIVIGHCQDSSIPVDKLKAIRQQLDTAAVVNDDLLSLAEWMSSYYHHPFGDTLLSLLPNQLRKGGSIDAYTQCCWKISHQGLGLPDDALTRAPKQASLLGFLRAAERDNAGKLTSESELKLAGHSRASALELAKKALATASDQPYYPADCQSLLRGQAQDQPPTLN